MLHKKAQLCTIILKLKNISGVHLLGYVPEGEKKQINSASVENFRDCNFQTDVSMLFLTESNIIKIK